MQVLLLLLLLLLLLTVTGPTASVYPECRDCGPRWTSVNTDHALITLHQGAPLTLRCPVRGKSQSQIHWYKDGQLLSPSPRVKFHRRALKVNRVLQSDSGNYTCLFSNLDGKKRRHFTLFVLGKGLQERMSVLEGFPSNLTVAMGFPATITCRVRTNVPYTARWLRYQQDIATLVETSHNIRQIRDSLEDFSDESADSTAEDWRSYGSSEVLDSGGDVAQQLWQQRHELSMEMDYSSSESSQEDDTDVRLIIQKAMPSDSGRYACLVMSAHTRIEKSAWLTVLPVDAVQLAYEERRQRWKERWGSDQGPEEYLRGIVISVCVFFILFVIALIVLFFMAILKAYRRQDVVLHVYDLRDV